MSHPLDKFAYCPVCGSKQFFINNFKSKHCAHCGFTYYANPCSATAVFILNGRGEMLVARRAKDPAKGTLDLVGGFVDMGESAEEGLKREILEETGMVVDQCRYLFSLPNDYLYSGLTIHTLDMFFECYVPEGATPAAADDVATLEWMPIEQVDPAAFGLNSVRKAVERYTSRKC